MTNLLFKNYNTGCYVAWSSSAGDYEPGSYCYGYASNLASYYADLKPNTTYTIQRIDNSTRFRLGLTATDIKYLTATSGTTIDQSLWAWGYRADSSEPITFTTTDTATHLCVYYTNNSEYSTRVMLNEGYTIQPYEAPTIPFGWYIDQDGQLTNSEFIEMPSKPFVGDSPLSMWRIVPTKNFGMPFVPLMIDIPDYIINPVQQREYITVHDKATPQNSFANNGLAVLCPSLCTITEELNGTYEVYMEHPLDADGKYLFVQEMNFLKVQGQIFYIYRVNYSYSGRQGTVRAWARHIFYVLNERWIYSTESLSASGAQAMIHDAYEAADYRPQLGDVNYGFRYETDLTGVQDICENHWKELTAGMTFSEWLMGSNGFIENCGGELYRDNFYFSVKQRREGTHEKAFEFRVGLNITGIQRDIDTTNLVTCLTGFDQYGNSYTAGETYNPSGLPRHVVRQVDLSDDIAGAEAVQQAVTELYNANNHANISYTLSVLDLRKNPDYAEMLSQSYEVGDEGYVVDPRITGSLLASHIQVKITRVERDGITGELKSVTFGNKHGYVSTRRNWRIKTDEEVKASKELDEVAFKAIVTTPICTSDEKYLVCSDGTYLLYKV